MLSQLKSSQSGQAIMEFMVAALFVLAPAIYLVVHLGKVGDLQHRAYEGARYSSWEQAKTTKSISAIQNEVNKRLLYKDYKAINSVNDRTSNNSTQNIDPLYTHLDDDGNLESFVVLKNGTFNTAATSAESPGSSYSLRVNAARAAGFDVSRNGMITSSIDLVTSKTKYFDGMSMHPHAWNTMILEDWRKVTRNEARSAIKKSLAANKIPIDSVVSLLKTLGSILGMPEWAEFDWGHIQPDVTNCTRLGPDSRGNYASKSDESACQ